ncbi:MAG: hypothetical protein M0006_03445 [Magnetospirillum sp.]|nr:hypothetical protein [Magnetospirillum sp.]
MSNRKVHTARLPASGPPGAVCRECRHWCREAFQRGGRQPHQWCWLALAQVGLRHANPRDFTKFLHGHTEACKCYEARPVRREPCAF